MQALLQQLEAAWDECTCAGAALFSDFSLSSLQATKPRLSPARGAMGLRAWKCGSAMLQWRSLGRPLGLPSSLFKLLQEFTPVL